MQMDFTAAVAQLLVSYARRVLPANILLNARRQRRQQPPQRQRQQPIPVEACGAHPLVRCVRFCVPCDASGAPLAPEPLRRVELWCDLASWGRVHVGSVPVPYDAEYRCAFPELVDAVLHRVPAGAAPPAGVHPRGRAASPVVAGSRHVVSLQLADELQILAEVDARLVGAKRSAGAAPAAR